MSQTSKPQSVSCASSPSPYNTLAKRQTRPSWDPCTSLKNSAPVIRESLPAWWAGPIRSTWGKHYTAGMSTRRVRLQFYRHIWPPSKTGNNHRSEKKLFQALPKKTAAVRKKIGRGKRPPLQDLSRVRFFRDGGGETLRRIIEISRLAAQHSSKKKTKKMH